MNMDWLENDVEPSVLQYRSLRDERVAVNVNGMYTYRLINSSYDRWVFMLVTVRHLSRSRFSCGPVMVHLKATLCLPQRIIDLCCILVMDLNDYTNPQFMETIGKTHNR